MPITVKVGCGKWGCNIAAEYITWKHSVLSRVRIG